jgi:hypothetical protein
VLYIGEQREVGEAMDMDLLNNIYLGFARYLAELGAFDDDIDDDIDYAIDDYDDNNDDIDDDNDGGHRRHHPRQVLLRQVRPAIPPTH